MTSETFPRFVFPISVFSQSCLVRILLQSISRIAPRSGSSIPSVCVSLLINLSSEFRFYSFGFWKLHLKLNFCSRTYFCFFCFSIISSFNFTICLFLASKMICNSDIMVSKMSFSINNSCRFFSFWEQDLRIERSLS